MEEDKQSLALQSLTMSDIHLIAKETIIVYLNGLKEVIVSVGEAVIITTLVLLPGVSMTAFSLLQPETLAFDSTLFTVIFIASQLIWFSIIVAILKVIHPISEKPWRENQNKKKDT